VEQLDQLVQVALLVVLEVVAVDQLQGSIEAA
jgi:hypothetical protein